MNETTPIALSLGGNVGDVTANFDRAVARLARKGLENIRLSKALRTSPVGCAEGTPDFTNAALSGDWPGSLFKLFHLCKALERDAGREEDHPRYASRPMDLDIVFFGDLIYEDDLLTIPHPEAKKRLFVLVPLAEIAGDWTFPDSGRTVADTLAQLSNSPEHEALMREI